MIAAGGVYTNTGAFVLEVAGPAPAPSRGDAAGTDRGGSATPTPRRLLLNVGCFNTACRLRVRSKLSGGEVQSDVVSTNATRNVAFSLIVREDIEVWWGRETPAAGKGGGGGADATNSNVAWQSAVLLDDG